MDSVFWLSFAGICAGILSGLLVYLNKSKCKTFSCFWGCFRCNRDTKGEIDLEEYKIEHHIPESPITRV